MSMIYDVPCNVVVLCKGDMRLCTEIMRIRFKDTIDVESYGWYDDTGHEYEIDDAKFYDITYLNKRLKDERVPVEVIRADGSFNTKAAVKVINVFSVFVDEELP